MLEATGYACDVADENQVESVIGKIRRDYGAPSVLVHNAVRADGAGKNIMEWKLSDLSNNFEVNMLGLNRLIQMLGPDISPNEQDGPGIMFDNKKPCVKNGAMSVQVDFFLPDQKKYKKDYHRCVWQGTPERFIQPNPAKGGSNAGYSKLMSLPSWWTATPEDHIAAREDPGKVDADSGTILKKFKLSSDPRAWSEHSNADFPGSITATSPGYHRHVFSAEDCTNGQYVLQEAKYTCESVAHIFVKALKWYYKGRGKVRFKSRGLYTTNWEQFTLLKPFEVTNLRMRIGTEIERCCEGFGKHRWLV